MPPGKYASRKSLRPDRPRSKPVFPNGAAENAELCARAEAVEGEVLDDMFLRENSPVLEDLLDVSGSGGSDAVVAEKDVASHPNEMGDTSKEEDAPSNLDTLVDGSEEDYASIQGFVVADAAEEDSLPEPEGSIQEINQDEASGATFTYDESAALVSIREASLNGTEIGESDRRVVSMSPHVNKHTACTVQSTEEDEETATTPTPVPEDAISCIEAIIPKMKTGHLSEPDISDLANPTALEDIDVDSNELEFEDNITPSESVKEEASTEISQVTPHKQSILKPDRLNIEAGEQSPLLTDPKASSSMGLYWSPNISMGAQRLDITVSEHTRTRFSSNGQKDAYSEEESCRSPKPAQDVAGDIVTQELPIAQRTRHSIRLSMEDLTPEEITEAAIVFHDYRSRKSSERMSEASLDPSQAGENLDDTSQTPPRADPLVTVEREETSEESVEAPKGRTRSGARFSDDTNMLKEFLSRAQARKLAQPSSIPMSAPKPLDSPRRTPRQALAELDSNSPSTQKQRDIANRPGTPPGKGKLAAVDFDDLEEPVPEPTSCRRSTRTRSPAPSKPTLGAPSFIPVRRADGTDPVVLQKSVAQELAIVTRANTRRNKGQAKTPSLALQNLPTEGSELAGVKHGNNDAKAVGWDEKLVYFQDVPESTEGKEEKRPRVRRLRGLGGVNGTPAPKKMMADFNIAYGTPAPKRQGKIR